jgi:integral membrane protein
MTKAIRALRAIGWAEGLSFLLLLGVAMPLKHLAGKPLAVRILGILHGVLFLAYLAMLAQVHVQARWKPSRTLLFFVGALLPFGPFLLDGRLRQEEQQERP